MWKFIYLEFLKIRHQKLLFYLFLLVILLPVLHIFLLDENFKNFSFNRWSSRTKCNDFGIYYIERMNRVNVFSFSLSIFLLVFSIIKIDQNPKGISMMQIVPKKYYILVFAKIFTVVLYIGTLILFYLHIFWLVTLYVQQNLSLNISFSYLYFWLIGLHLFISCIFYMLFCFIICIFFGKAVYFIFVFSVIIIFFGIPIVPSALFLDFKIIQQLPYFYFPPSYLFVCLVIIGILLWVLSQKNISIFKCGL